MHMHCAARACITTGFILDFRKMPLFKSSKHTHLAPVEPSQKGAFSGLF